MSNNDEMVAFAKLCSKLENFVKYVLKAEPSAQQLDLIRAVDNGERFISVKSGHGCGKTSALSWIAIWWALTKYDAKIPITAPSSPQLLLTFMPELRKWINVLPKILRDEIIVKTDEINFKNNNFIALRTARKETPEALQGFHAEHLLFLVDEASGVVDEIFEIVMGALTGAKNTMIMVGNPTRTSGFFYEAFHKNKNIWGLFTFNSELSSNVSKEQIERARIQYGVDSNAYKVRILGEFPSASDDALFSVEALENAVDRKITQNDSDNVVWGLDPAEMGDDSSVLCKRKGFYVYPFIKFQNLDAEPLANAIMSEYKKSHIKPSAIYVDIIGVGAGVWSILYSKGLPVIRADARSKTYKENLYNKRIEMYMRLKEYMNMVHLPNDNDLFGELSAMRYEVQEQTGKTKLEAKKAFKNRVGRSPDKADSLALTFYDEIEAVDDINDNVDYDNPRIAKAYRDRAYSDSWEVAW